MPVHERPGTWEYCIMKTRTAGNVSLQNPQNAASSHLSPRRTGSADPVRSENERAGRRQIESVALCVCRRHLRENSSWVQQEKTAPLPIFRPLAEVRLLKPGIQRRWLAKDAPLPFRFASRFFNRFPVALPLRCFHLEEVSSRPPLSSNIFGRDPLSNVSYWNCGRPKLSKSP